MMASPNALAAEGGARRFLCMEIRVPKFLGRERIFSLATTIVFQDNACKLTMLCYALFHNTIGDLWKAHRRIELSDRGGEQ